MPKIDPAICEHCGKRNTNLVDIVSGVTVTVERGRPTQFGGDGEEVVVEWECYDCGEAYRVTYAPVSKEPI